MTREQCEGMLNDRREVDVSVLQNTYGRLDVFVDKFLDEYILAEDNDRLRGRIRDTEARLAKQMALNFYLLLILVLTVLFLTLALATKADGRRVEVHERTVWKTETITEVERPSDSRVKCNASGTSCWTVEAAR